MPRPLPIVLAALALTGTAAIAQGCGKDSSDVSGGPRIGQKGVERSAARVLGFPAFATKNTTRVGGADPTADAAGVARAVYAGTSETTRPLVVALVGTNDWQGGIAASVFMSAPLRAPILLSNGNDLPDASADALGSLDPLGTKAADGAQVIRVGNVAKPGGFKTTSAGGDNPYRLAQEIDRLQSAAAGKPSDRILIASGERPDFAMPAAGWAAKSGDPVLYVKRNEVPKETLSAVRAHQAPKIYVLGPPSVISQNVVDRLRKLGSVTRIGGRDPIANAIAFARFVDGRFGWGVVDPGHGLIFVNARRPLDAPAAAPLAASGKYGPILLTQGQTLPPALVQYLLDIQPGYERDPVRGVYNHGWLMGDEGAISLADQSRIDSLLEIVPVSASNAPRRPSS